MNISPEYLSYIIGFIQGDGHNYMQSRNRGKISIELSIKDVDILNKINNCFNDVHINRCIRCRDTNFKQKYVSCALNLYDMEIRKYLSKFIPTGKKSAFITPPTNEQFFNKYDYIRGLTDADGSVGITANNRPFWSLCTYSEPIKIFIIEDIKNTLNFEKRLNRNNRDNIYNIVLYDEDAVEYTKLLYGKANIFLDRKYCSYLDVQRWVRSIPKRYSRMKKWLYHEDIIVLDNSISIKEKIALLNRTRSSIETRLWRLKQK